MLHLCRTDCCALVDLHVCAGSPLQMHTSVFADLCSSICKKDNSRTDSSHRAACGEDSVNYTHTYTQWEGLF